MHYLTMALYLGNACGLRNWFLRQILAYSGGNAWLDSGYMFCIGAWFWTNYAHFLRRNGLDSCGDQSLFSRRMEKRAQPMLQLSVPVAMLALWNSGNLLHEFHVTDRGDDGGSVRRHWPM